MDGAKCYTILTGSNNPTFVNNNNIHINISSVLQSNILMTQLMSCFAFCFHNSLQNGRLGPNPKLHDSFFPPQISFSLHYYDSAKGREQ